jgi:hypothetical protein
MKFTAIRSTFAVLAVVLPVALALPSSAHAQAATPKAPAPSAAPAPAPAPVPVPVPVTPEARAAIKELLDAMNMRENLTKNFQGALQNVAPQMAESVGRQIDGDTTLTPEQKSKVLAGMKTPFDNAMKEVQGILTSPKLVDDTMAKMVPIFAKYFTTPEIKQLTVFYKSPVGAKALNTMPQAIGESLQTSFVELQPRLNAIVDKMVKTQIDAVTKK